MRTISILIVSVKEYYRPQGGALRGRRCGGGETEAQADRIAFEGWPGRLTLTSLTIEHVKVRRSFGLIIEDPPCQDSCRLELKNFRGPETTKMNTYSPERKAALIARMMPPHNQSVVQLA
ncbi:hypothetical protein, partial [Serratia ficaria]|uniref:hypothetical protein n=1 Tax=Serratia ficaria TaxID=61651 RepID=UPI0021C9B723